MRCWWAERGGAPETELRTNDLRSPTARGAGSTDSRRPAPTTGTEVERCDWVRGSSLLVGATRSGARMGVAGETGSTAGWSVPGPELGDLQSLRALD